MLPGLPFHLQACLSIRVSCTAHLCCLACPSICRHPGAFERAGCAARRVRGSGAAPAGELSLHGPLSCISSPVLITWLSLISMASMVPSSPCAWADLGRPRHNLGSLHRTSASTGYRACCWHLWTSMVCRKVGLRENRSWEVGQGTHALAEGPGNRSLWGTKQGMHALAKEPRNRSFWGTKQGMHALAKEPRNRSVCTKGPEEHKGLPHWL